MSTIRRTTLVGVAALLVAVALIATAAMTGLLPGVQNVNTTKTGAGSPAGTGSLSILLTDPPITPAGVTKVYVSYSDIMIHVSGAGNETGWYPVNAKGTIELLGSVNVSQTLATVNVASGVYDFIKFNITSAEVTYNGSNYTAFVRTSTLYVPIVGGVQVNDSKPSATILDLQTTVMNIGSQSDPEFMIRPVVTAYPVPPGQVTSSMQQPGYRLGLGALVWWRQISESYTANLQITSASLSSGSLSLTVKNTGNATTTLGLVTIAPLSDFLGGQGMLRGRTAGGLLSTETFVVLQNGTLVPLRNFYSLSVAAMAGGQQAGNAAYESLFGSTGYGLPAGSSVTFAFSGQLTVGFPPFDGGLSSAVISGQQYTVTVLGTSSVASYVATAT